jgi:hypothetical protein
MLASQESFYLGIHLHTVMLAFKKGAFVFFKAIYYRHVAFFQFAHKLVQLADIGPGVFSALEYQQRALYFIGMENRRYSTQLVGICFGVAYHFVGHF